MRQNHCEVAGVEYEITVTASRDTPSLGVRQDQPQSVLSTCDRSVIEKDLQCGCLLSRFVCEDACWSMARNYWGLVPVRVQSTVQYIQVHSCSIA